MELNLKILAPLRQCTSKNRCALVIRRKNIYIILITRWIKIMPLIQSLSLSFSLSLSHLWTSLSLSHSLTPASHFLTLSLRSLTPSLRPASHSLTLSTPITQALNPPLLPTQLTDVIGACSSWVFFFFFFFYAMDWCWWWWWWWLWPWLRKKIGDSVFFF